MSGERVQTQRSSIPVIAVDEHGVPAGGRVDLFAVAVGCFALVAGIVSLTGWAAEIPRLTDWFANGTSMMPNAALATGMVGLALIGIAIRRPRAAIVIGAVFGAMSVATLAEHLFGVSVGLDSALFHREWGQAGTVAPGRMGVPAAASFTILSAALVLAAGSTPGGWCRRAVAAAGLLVIGVASLSLVGRLFGADLLYTVPRYTAIAGQTSTVLLVLGLGVVASVPEVEPVATLRSESAAGGLVRRVLPVLLILPIALGWARLQGQRADLFDLAFGTSLGSMVEIVLLVSLLWWAARAVRRHESALARSDAALRRQSEDLAAIVESSDDAIVSIALDGVIASWNRGAERIFGYSAEEAVGRPIKFIIPRERWSEEDHTLARIARGEKFDHFVTERRAKDGRPLTVSLTVSPIRDATGRVIGASKVTRDITLQKVAEAEVREGKERMRLATEATGVGIWERNVLTGMVRWDAQMFRIYGIPPTGDGVIEYTTWSGSVEPGDLQRQEAALDETIAGRASVTREFRIRRRDNGEYRDIQAVETVRLNAEGAVEWVVGTNLDVTERNMAQAALSAQQQILEQRVEERTRQIETAYRRVAAADRMAAVGTMAAGLTHDMNNVLLPMSIRLNTLVTLPALPEHLQADLVAVTKLLGHLREMSRSLSLFARDPAHEGSVGRTDLAEWQAMVREFIEMSATGRAGPGTAAEGAVRIEWDVPAGLPPIAVAPHRLTQAVLNLVHNARDSIFEGRRQDQAASRHGGGRGWITVAAGRGEESGALGCVTISVIDDGCGMDEATRQRCTEPFFTTKDGVGAPGVGGTGLGMAIAHSITERAGGRIEIESTVGVGTTVTLVFPITQEESVGAAAAG